MNSEELFTKIMETNDVLSYLINKSNIHNWNL